MNGYAQRSHALPFFLKTAAGDRFCLYYPPHPGAEMRGSLLYVHPFAEELNKSRRMAALQARAYAHAGYGVLQLDLYGCGDSSGDFSDARWEIWLADLALGWQWLAEHSPGPAYLWGLRLGALLALQFAEQARPAPAGLVLWQAVVSGRPHLHQFMRLQNAARMFGAGEQDAMDEVAGYTLDAELCDAIRNAEAGNRPACPVQWLELAAPPQPAALQPASALLLERWERAGAHVDAYPLAGAPFWTTPEIAEVPALITATLAAMPLGPV
ncbi:MULTISPECIES: hydrolase 2, exosortase A system-associated [unclassified Duganella]|uniref:hydrolase 2, exosortase A system-associated n=1 Tax=unclassified Duganella TaxID=2636909 RepID=UPI000E340CE1|nr:MULTISPECIES: hydrolase 2, exosortase A system-associated [unclassified Duganella]RFP19479.1 hydrolase 2, exosortase A system-associated [Duganella sp. BJB475]RFP36060.1 hydrolase 2, exosortase A system-associated [Duganella sp. BJB476]